MPLNATVQVVDDEEQIRRLVSLALETEGHTVVAHRSAEDYEEALGDSAAPHVLIVDKNLPGITGLQLVAKLREQSRAVFEAIMITGFADDASEHEATRLGFFQFIRKPFMLSELRAAVAGAAARLDSRTP